MTDVQEGAEKFSKKLCHPVMKSLHKSYATDKIVLKISKWHRDIFLKISLGINILLSSINFLTDFNVGSEISQLISRA